jgi:flagellar protein FlbD
MIRLTRFCGEAISVNSDLIERVVRKPDTVVTLTSGNRLTVQETPEQIADEVRDFRHSLLEPRGKKS